jgi:hypothetical protein
MSATVADDSFLIRGLQLTPDVIGNPLVYSKERWSGEKMILIPSLIDEGLTRELIVKEFAVPKPKKYGVVVGVVALTPSFAGTKDWERYKGLIVKSDTIKAALDRLRNRSFDVTIVLVNRYDGIDLPDDTCRVLIFDGKPYTDNLSDRYEETCRPSSDAIATWIARSIEQGLGRSVRGEKDYCVIVLIGPELVAAVKSTRSLSYLSNQTRKQIEIGLEVAELAKEDVGNEKPLDCLRELISQCVKRDDGWKDFYVERMDATEPDGRRTKVLEVLTRELEAEMKARDLEPRNAAKTLQKLLDDCVTDEADRGWYLQEMARFTFSFDKQESNRLQQAAHKKNKFLLKPRTGMEIDDINVVSQKRIERIKEWFAGFENPQEMMIQVSEVLDGLRFGVRAEKFEASLHTLGKALGFGCQRPDKEWGSGPDNLWGIKENQFVLFECKSEVDIKRADIAKTESGQMNNSCAWFRKRYPGVSLIAILVIPTNHLGPAGGIQRGGSHHADKGTRNTLCGCKRLF